MPNATIIDTVRIDYVDLLQITVRLFIAIGTDFMQQQAKGARSYERGNFTAGKQRNPLAEKSVFWPPVGWK